MRADRRDQPAHLAFAFATATASGTATARAALSTSAPLVFVFPPPNPKAASAPSERRQQHRPTPSGRPLLRRQTQSGITCFVLRAKAKASSPVAPIPNALTHSPMRRHKREGRGRHTHTHAHRRSREQEQAKTQSGERCSSRFSKASQTAPAPQALPVQNRKVETSKQLESRIAPLLTLHALGAFTRRRPGENKSRGGLGR